MRRLFLPGSVLWALIAVWGAWWIASILAGSVVLILVFFVTGVVIATTLRQAPSRPVQVSQGIPIPISYELKAACEHFDAEPVIPGQSLGRTEITGWVCPACGKFDLPADWTPPPKGSDAFVRRVDKMLNSTDPALTERSRVFYREVDRLVRFGIPRPWDMPDDGTVKLPSGGEVPVSVLRAFARTRGVTK